MSELVPHMVPYDDAVETINAIHHGQVDAVVVIKGVEGPQVVLLEGADKQSRPQESEQDDKWSFCLTAGTLCPANQERQ